MMNRDATNTDGPGARHLLPPLFGGAAWSILLLAALRAARPLLGTAEDPLRAAALGGLLIGAAAGALAGGRGRGRGLRAAIRFVPAGAALLLPFLLRLEGTFAGDVLPPLLAALLGLCLGAAAAETSADPGRGVPGFAVALLGGAVGALVAGWLLLPTSGLVGASLVSFALFLVAGGSLILPGTSSAPPPEESGEGERGISFFLFFAAAAAAWTVIGFLRIGDLILGSTERNLALLTGLLLLGWSGGLTWSGFSRRSSTNLMISIYAVLFSSILMLVLFFAPRLAYEYGARVDSIGLSPGRIFRAAALLAALLVLPASLPLGAASGALLRRVGGRSGFGRAGVALAAGVALGAVNGSRLLPALGVRGLLAGAGALLLFTAVLVLLFSRRRRLPARILGAAPLLLLLLVVLVQPPRWKPGLVASGFFRFASLHQGEEWEEFRMEQARLPAFYRDGAAATVMVIGAPGMREVRKDGWLEGSDRGLRPVEILLARLPLLFRPEAKSAAVLGAGAGITAGTLLEAGAEEVTLVDPEPSAFRAIRYFERVNGEPWTDERFRARTADPRTWLGREGSFDVILCGKAYPADRRRAHLRTEEFFRLAASRLNEGGVAACPLPLGGLREEHLRSLLRSFRAAFPEVLAFRAGDRASLILLGSDRPLRLPAAEALARWEDMELSGDFADAGIRLLEGLVAAARLDGPGIDRYAGATEPNRDAAGFAEHGSEWRLRELENRDLDRILRGLGHEGESFLDFEGMDRRERARLHFRIARAYRREKYGPAGLRHAAASWRLEETAETAEQYAYFLRNEADDLDSAIAVSRRGLALAPGDAPLIRRLADDLFSARRFTECESFLTGLMAGGFRQTWTYLIRGKARLAQGRHEEGLEDFFQAKEMDRLQDTKGTINFFIGMAMKNLGRIEESQNYLGRTIRRNPRHRLARYEFGENRLLLGEIDRAAFEEEYLVPNNRARAESLFVRSEKNLYEPGHAGEVERGLITVINSTPNHYGAYLRLAEFYARRGEPEAERKVLERVIAHFAGRPAIRSIAEEYLRRTGGEEKVRAHRDLLAGGAAPPPEEGS